MKKILIILCCFIATNCYAQNVVKLVRTLRWKPIALERTINTSISESFAAIDIAKRQAPNNWYFDNNGDRIQVVLQKKLLEGSIKSPTTLYGPYIYLKQLPRLINDEKLFDEKFKSSWNKINKTQGYNGVHHLISKSTIKLIHIDLKSQGKKVSLSDMENNAPSIFHPLHGHPDCQKIFHNTEQQFFDYKRFGMKVTIISLLERIDKLNVSLGAQPYPEWYLEGVLKEAELWCKHYGIVWEPIYK